MRIAHLAIAALVFTASTAEAQDRDLRRGRAVAATLQTGDAHGYTITARADQFIYARADQKTVDIVVELIAPDGSTMRTIDGPARGAEHVQFETDEAGTYRIVVTPFEDEEGDYTIVLDKQEPIAQDPEDRVDQLVAAYSSPDTPGVVVQVWQNGRTLFRKAYGAANLTYGLPNTVNTPMNIGSTSKQFTAFAVMLLAEDDSLSLDDDVREHLPELKDFGTPVTVRHLLTHTTGYREFLNLLGMDGRRLDHSDWIDRDELVPIVNNQPALQNTPGDEFNYNNTAFALAADLVARVSGVPFPEFMRTRVFEPLGMTSTMVRESREHIVPMRSIGYTPFERGFREIPDLGGAMGAGGIYSTVGDLQKWAENFRNPVVGSAETMAEMQTSFVLNDSTETGYGLGLFMDEQRGLRRVHHGGADVAHRSQLVRYPDINAGLTSQSNHASFDGGIAWQIAEAFFGESMETEAVAESGEEFDPASFDPETFDDYAGRYALDAAPSFVLTFTRDGDQFYTQATGQQQFEIFATSDSTFKLTVVEASMTFHRDADGSVNRVTLHQGGNQPATRIVEEGDGPWEPSEAELLAYEGRYFSAEIETFYTVTVEDGALVMKHRRSGPFQLTAGERDAFSTGTLLGQVEFVRDRAGSVVAFYASNGRTRDVRFERR